MVNTFAGLQAASNLNVRVVKGNVDAPLGAVNGYTLAHTKRAQQRTWHQLEHGQNDIVLCDVGFAQPKRTIAVHLSDHPDP